MNKEILLVSLLSGVVGLASVAIGAILGISKIGSMTAVNKTTATVQSTYNHPKVFLTTDKTNLNTGEQFTVTINVDTNGDNMQGADVALVYDPKELTAVDADAQKPGIQLKPGSLFSQPITLANTVDVVNGRAILSLSSFVAPFNGAGTYGTIDFKITGKPGSTMVAVLPDPDTRVAISNTHGMEIPVDLGNSLNLLIQ